MNTLFFAQNITVLKSAIDSDGAPYFIYVNNTQDYLNIKVTMEAENGGFNYEGTVKLSPKETLTLNFSDLFPDVDYSKAEEPEIVIYPTLSLINKNYPSLPALRYKAKVERIDTDANTKETLYTYNYNSDSYDFLGHQDIVGLNEYIQVTIDYADSGVYTSSSVSSVIPDEDNESGTYTLRIEDNYEEINGWDDGYYDINLYWNEKYQDASFGTSQDQTYNLTLETDNSAVNQMHVYVIYDNVVQEFLLDAMTQPWADDVYFGDDPENIVIIIDKIELADGTQSSGSSSGTTTEPSTAIKKVFLELFMSESDYEKYKDQSFTTVQVDSEFFGDNKWNGIVTIGENFEQDEDSGMYKMVVNKDVYYATSKYSTGIDYWVNGDNGEYKLYGKGEVELINSSTGVLKIYVTCILIA
jgi:hypothetical protein